jgi:hypothetical protein
MIDLVWRGGLKVVPFSTCRTITEPDEYAAIVRALHRLTVTQRRMFSARQLWMQRLSDNLPPVDNCDISAERATHRFSSTAGGEFGGERRATSRTPHYATWPWQELQSAIRRVVYMRDVPAD